MRNSATDLNIDRARNSLDLHPTLLLSRALYHYILLIYAFFNCSLCEDSGLLNIAMAERVGFEWGDNSRSTLTLLWSCLVTVFACTWTVIHLNMPASYDTFWSIVFRKSYWFLLTLVAPEVTVLVAFQQYLLCIEFTKDMKIIYPYWTRTHSFYAIMGGYVLQFENSASYKYCASSMSALQFLRFHFGFGVRPSFDLTERTSNDCTRQVFSLHFDFPKFLSRKSKIEAELMASLSCLHVFK